MVTAKMSLVSRREYLKRIKPRYLKSTKDEKEGILDEFCSNAGYNRKYAIRILSPFCDAFRPLVINRKIHHTYTNEDVYWLKKIWEILDYPCGQRLAPVLPETIDRLVQFKELNIPENAKEKLKLIAPSTIDERLRRFKSELRRKINSTTRPGSLIKKNIPIRTVSWNERRIGCAELDTVAHCGDNASGEFISSLDLTDILTGWTETEAVLGRAQRRIIEGLENIKNRLPFPLLAIDPDNGSEFINWQLFEYCMQRKIEFTRGRPYAKNDNAHIEQKNWTHVRKVFGYRRRETEEELNLMNDIYRNELRLYKNFFLPNVKLISKKRTGKHSEKIKRVYDKAKTPYRRVMECGQISEAEKLKLKEQYESLNPAELRRKILAKINRLNNLIFNKSLALKPNAKVTFSIG